MLYAFMRRVVLGVLRTVFRLRTVGLENVPREGGVLLASNHVSFLDPPVVGAGVTRPLHFMAKAELFRIPGLGGLIRRLNAHPVDRAGSDGAALRMAVGLLRDGCGVLVFPEGTRGTADALRPARGGVGMLAALADVPVVPVYVQGTSRALPRGAKVPRPTRITVAYGPALRFPKARGRARYQVISDEIMAAIGRLKTEVEQSPLAGVAPSVEPHDMDRTARGPLPAGRIH